jgi:hypothetical protein
MYQIGWWDFRGEVRGRPDFIGSENFQRVSPPYALRDAVLLVLTTLVDDDGLLRWRAFPVNADSPEMFT